MIRDTGKSVLIDHWFPVEEASFESVRERSAYTALPPTYYLHVWFARRPLVASRAAILGSILSSDVAKENVLRLLGIPIGVDVRKAELARDRAKSTNTRLINNPFTWNRAFKHMPNHQELAWLSEVLKQTWGTDKLVILDPMAGGGSIPYETLRLGQAVVAGDLNPVAFLCLKGTVEYPAKFGERLLSPVKMFCEGIQKQARKELNEFFPRNPGEEILRYLWARAIRCSSCRLVVPLSPNWWVAHTNDEEENLGVQLSFTPTSELCTFTLVKGRKSKDCAEKGTVHGGDAECPRCKTVLGGDYVKSEARAGRMGHQLYAVSVKVGGKPEFRSPQQEDLDAFDNAAKALKKKLPQWEADRIVPSEEYYKGFSDRCSIYGVRKWSDLFNPRQFLAHLTYLEKFNNAKTQLLQDAVSTDEREFAVAVITYAAMVFDACIDYNSILTRWRPTRQMIAGTMAMQAFPFRWSYAEAEHIDSLWSWALTKVVGALRELVILLPRNSASAHIYHGSATRIPLNDKSVHCIVVDPPYAENVMYAEVSDFFYVWLKRLVGDIYPDVFRLELTEKAEEVVSNPVRFKGYKQGAKTAARQDYSLKMEACFREMYRVLKDEGVLTVMFTHREVEAWSGLAIALMRAGYTFRSSWPVHTEPGEKFGKREKGVLKATIMLACHKRQIRKPGIWEHMRDELRELAKVKIDEFSSFGIEGSDLRVSVYGPILGSFADYYPVKTATGEEIGPTEALNLVVEVLNERFLKESNVQGADKETCAYLNLLSTFPSGIMDYDEARLATVFGGLVTLDALDVKGEAKTVKKEKDKVVLLSARDRMAAGLLKPHELEHPRYLIDAVHASILLYEKRGVGTVKEMLRQHSLDVQGTPFLNVLEAYTRYADASENESFRKDAAIAKPLLAALGSSASFTRMKGESLDHYPSDS